MKHIISILAACPVLLAATATWPQTPPADTSFDGKWVWQSIECFPKTGQSRFNALTVKDSKFSLRFTVDGRTRRCSVVIGADGSFDNQSCDVPTSGKISGSNMALNYKNEDKLCKVALKRE